MVEMLMADARSFKLGMIRILALGLLTMIPGGMVMPVQAWGTQGHEVICIVAQELLNPIAATYVEELLPDSAGGNLSKMCNWADEVRHSKGYTWSAPLHFVDTPDKSCGYSYKRDCKDEHGTAANCVAGAVTNYTSQLLSGSDQHNQTEALMFLSHFVGDIHQPLHCGFKGDSGGNLLDVYWYNSETNLHHIWDVDIIKETVKQFYNEDTLAMINSIKSNITTVWRHQASKWATCTNDEVACADTYAVESVKAACQYAYSDFPDGDGDVSQGEILADDYFNGKYAFVEKRLGQASVRLATILNRIFPDIQE